MSGIARSEAVDHPSVLVIEHTADTGAALVRAIEHKGPDSVRAIEHKAETDPALVRAIEHKEPDSVRAIEHTADTNPTSVRAIEHTKGALVSALDPDPETIRSTWRWLTHSPHGVAEVRVIRPTGGSVGIGFFDNEDAFVSECIRANPAGNVYVGIQPRPRRLLEQAANAIRPLRNGAGRKDIEVVVGTVIDLDPVRPKNTASTEEELAVAIKTAEAAAAWCESQGLVRPRLMMSGNGAQLWFALPPTALQDERRARIQAGLKRFEETIREHFQSDIVHVDSIHDVARIIKVIGTVSHKGDGLGDRPHRVSMPLDGFDRLEDAALLAQIDKEPPATQSKRQSSSRSRRAAESSLASTKAARTAEGQYNWECPVEMCGPVQRLWEQGAEDRSLAIFDMIRFFAHKGLSLSEITPLLLEYDRRGLGKLTGRDGEAYIKNAYEKIEASRQPDGTIAPPCHSLQKLGYCRVNCEPGVRCDNYSLVFDIDKAIEAVPDDTPADELKCRLKPVLDAISRRSLRDQESYLSQIERRFGIVPQDLGIVPSATPAPIPEQATQDAFDGEIYEDACFYYVLAGRDEAKVKVLSSFAITPTVRVSTEAGEVIIGEAHTDRGTTIAPLRLPLGAFHSKRDLIQHLPSADLQWTGTDNNVQGLLRLLARRPVPRRPGATMLGEYRRNDLHVWLGPDCAIGKDGFLDPSPVVYVPNGGSLDKRICYRPADDETFLAIARVVFEQLPNLNKPEVILPILGWFFATPMKPSFMQKVGSFPTLFVWGTQGSGKSSLCIDVMWPLFGVRDAEPYSATETEFALLKLLTSTCSVPVFIDEYKPYDMHRQRLNTLHRYLRRLYRGETEERGRPDLKVNTYHLQAPLCVAGETRPIEAALLERIITANPEKTTLAEHPFCKQAYHQLRSVDLTLFAPRYIQFCLGRDFAADLLVAQHAARTLVGNRNVPIRVVENLTAMLLGIHLFEEFAKHCGCELPNDLGVQAAVDAVLADVLETDHGVKNALDYFLETLGVMAVQEVLKYHIHYVFDNDRLAIHLESAYDAFRAHCKRIDYQGELVDLKALRRLITENKKQGGFVIAESERICFDGRENRRRAVLIDLSKTDIVSADDFPLPSESERWSLRGYNKARGGWNEPS